VAKVNWGWRIAKCFTWLLKVRSIRRFVSREYTDYLASSTPARPHGYSLWGEAPKPSTGEGETAAYIAWPTLTDHAFSARHLPPASSEPRPVEPPPPAALPPGEKKWDATTELWRRPDQMVPCQRSSVLFAFFAQWFTDSILRIDPRDRRRNTSTHHIDLCQIYGLDEKTTRLLRRLSNGEKEKGQLAHRIVPSSRGAQQYPDLLCERTKEGNVIVKERYRALPYAGNLPALLDGFEPERMEHLYATGLERGNSSIAYVAISTLFLREHNRLCLELEERNPQWDDERIFQTARVVNIVILLKLLIDEYINHILGERLFLLEPGFAERRSWYRHNWIALEFDLLYRWHGLVPDELRLDGKPRPHKEFRNNGRLFEELGLARVLEDTSQQRAGRIGLGNTPLFLLGAEYESVRMSRLFRLQSFNEYCKRFSMAPLRSFKELTRDEALAARLAAIYPSVDDVELLVGLFAESADPGVLFGPLMARMVAYDALTQIYSNPLLSSEIYGEGTFTRYGLDQIEATTSLQALVSRNVPGDARVSFAAP
jgi:prostaglandin-endoperoxide synthase 2